jgi:cobalt-zinc-cadmium resistance protein CzcA
MDRELEKIPGALWNFSQPIADNMEEAVSGVKGELAIKIYGDDLKTLEAKGDEIVKVMRTVNGRRRSRAVPRHRAAQLNVRRWIARKPRGYGINVADMQDAIQTAVGGKAVTQVLQGEQRYDLVVRYQAPYRDTKKRSRTSACSRRRASASRWRSCARYEVLDGASEIYREGNSRYVAVKYSVRGRDLGSTVEEAIARSTSKSSCRAATTSIGPANTKAPSVAARGWP